MRGRRVNLPETATIIAIFRKNTFLTSLIIIIIMNWFLKSRTENQRIFFLFADVNCSSECYWGKKPQTKFLKKRISLFWKKLTNNRYFTPDSRACIIIFHTLRRRMDPIYFLNYWVYLIWVNEFIWVWINEFILFLIYLFLFIPLVRIWCDDKSCLFDGRPHHYACKISLQKLGKNSHQLSRRHNWGT